MSPRFGRCPYFLIIDTETQKVEALENVGVRAAHGAGVSAAQIVADAGCQVVITGNVGPNAFYALNAAGIKIFIGPSGKTCEQILKAYNDEDLKEASGSKPCGPGGGLGRGYGRGQRRGRR
jgi:predicted Fe-Mo cluster-binding NifX family protein